MKTYSLPGKSIPKTDGFDVIVCGGGPAGWLAAVAAARSGVKTLLIERYGFLGGTATAALMVEFGSINNGKEIIVGGIVREFFDRLIGKGGVNLHSRDTYQMIFDVESMIALCLEMAREAGVELLFHAMVVDAIREGNNICGVIVESKSGTEAFFGKVVVDATGDGDVAARAGGEFVIGRDGDGKVQPVTLEIILGNVDTTRVPDSRSLMPTIAEAAKSGQWPIPTERIFSWGRVKKRGEADNPASAFFFLNATNSLDVNGVSVRDLTRAEIETRSQVEPLVKFLRKYAAGFENCYLDRTGAQVGIRETRRITGDYQLTRDDVLSSRHFADGVVPACNNIDVHEVAGKDFKHYYLKDGTHYEIPYRCFLPKSLDGILVAGRCLSADHWALGSARVMVICLPMGEAVGVAAGMAVKTGQLPRAIFAGDVRSALKQRGYVL